jgi:hypothetical protein
MTSFPPLSLQPAVAFTLNQYTGITVAELVRARALNRPVVPRTDATTIRELRRLGGLLKKVHVDSGGAYSRDTGSALTALRAAIILLARDDRSS